MAGTVGTGGGPGGIPGGGITPSTGGGPPSGTGGPVPPGSETSVASTGYAGSFDPYVIDPIEASSVFVRLLLTAPGASAQLVNFDFLSPDHYDNQGLWTPFVQTYAPNGVFSSPTTYLRLLKYLQTTSVGLRGIRLAVGGIDPANNFLALNGMTLDVHRKYPTGLKEVSNTILVSSYFSPSNAQLTRVDVPLADDVGNHSWIRMNTNFANSGQVTIDVTLLLESRMEPRLFEMPNERLDLGWIAEPRIYPRTRPRWRPR